MVICSIAFEKSYCIYNLFNYNYLIVFFQDCFFVSVVIRNYPELLDKPVAVCHSDNPKGTAEISSANYPARDYGALYKLTSQL